MAAKKDTATKDILSLYMHHALEHESFPSSVYKFCKANDIDEAEFYQSYASMDTVKHAIWTAFYDNTHQLLSKNKDFEQLSRKDRLLTFYYTFFEKKRYNF